jgi:hypothetical protein
MRFRLALMAALGAAGLAPAAVAAASSSLRFTIANTGVTCAMTAASASCQTATSSATISATLTPDGSAAICRQPRSASPGCILWPGAMYKNVFIDNPEPTVGRFACIPIGNLAASITGTVCTVSATGKGFRITTGKVARVNQISPGPHPACTRAALTAALERAYRKRSLAPSYISRGWQCAGNYARADLIDVHGHVADDVTVVFRAAARVWSLAGRGKVCEDGEIPARIWLRSCAVN